MKENSFDWDMDLALEIGLVAEATTETQKKLDAMRDAYLENDQHTRDSMIGTFPRTVLESEAEQRMKSKEESHRHEIKNLEQTIKSLEWKNLCLQEDLRKLKEELK